MRASLHACVNERACEQVTNEQTSEGRKEGRNKQLLKVKMQAFIIKMLHVFVPTPDSRRVAEFVQDVASFSIRDAHSPCRRDRAHLKLPSEHEKQNIKNAAREGENASKPEKKENDTGKT